MKITKLYADYAFHFTSGPVEVRWRALRKRKTNRSEGIVEVST